MSTSINETTASFEPLTRREQTPLQKVSFFIADSAVPAAIKAFLWIWVAFNVLLVIWVIMNSMKSSGEILGSPFSLPTRFAVENYDTAWRVSGFAEATLTSLGYVSISTILIMVIATPAAYGLARFGGNGNGKWISYFALGMSLPLQTALIPLFLANTWLSNFMIDWVFGVWDPRIGLIIFYVAASLPWAVFVLTGYFKTLPRALIEAASLDGASASQTFRRIMVPVARGPITTISIIVAIGTWNETLLMLVLVPDGAKRSLPAALLNMYYSLQYTSNWGALFAGITILVLPMIILFMIMSRRIVEGVSVGVNK